MVGFNFTRCIFDDNHAKMFFMETKILNTYLSFRVGKETFALNTGNVISILEMKPITRIPEAPDYVTGVINFRGIALPIVDMRIALGFPISEETPETAIITTEFEFDQSTLKLGLLVDSLTGVFNLVPEEILPAPELTNLKREWISGLVQNDDLFIQIINMAALMDHANHHWIQKFNQPVE